MVFNVFFKIYLDTSITEIFYYKKLKTTTKKMKKREKNMQEKDIET